MASSGSDDGVLDDTGSTGGPAPDSPHSVIEQLVQARCDWVFSCCDEGEVDYRVGPFTADATDCTDRVMTSILSGNPTPPVQPEPADLLVLLAFSHAAGSVQLVDEQVAACVAYLEGEACAAPPPESEDQGPHCEPSDDLLDSPCALATMVDGLLLEGAACDPTLGVECAEGLTCVTLGSSGQCVTSSEEGDFCFSDDHCTTPLFCDFSDGTCVKGSALGEDCAFEDPDNPAPGTESVRCDPGLACDPIGLTCVGPCATGSPCATEADCPIDHDCILARCFIPQPTGGPCVVGAECISGYCEGGTCAGLSAEGEFCIPHSQCETDFCHPFFNECRPQQGDGQPCTSFSDQECAGGVCDNSDPMAPVCQAAVGEGGACISTNECNADLELQCINGTCQATPLANGQACTNGLQCESGLCWQLTCDDPALVGEACTTEFDPMVKPCGSDAYCATELGEVTGTCAAKGSTGTPCSEDKECWGSCTVLWGQLLCDATPAMGEAYCDGA